MFVAGNCQLHLLSKLIQAVKSDHGLFAFLVLHIGENIIGSILHGHTRLFLESLEADKVITSALIRSALLGNFSSAVS